MENPKRKAQSNFFVYEEGVKRDNTIGTSGHIRWPPETLYYPNLLKYDVTARIQEVGCPEGYHFLVGTIHVTRRESLMDQVILVNRYPLIKGGLAAKRCDDKTPVYV